MASQINHGIDKHIANIFKQLALKEKGDSKGIVFHSKEHSLKILDNLNNLRNKTKICDVVIAVSGKSFPTHRVVLAANSSYFEAMFGLGLAEEKKESVEIQGVSPQVFAKLLDFMYTGSIEICQDDVEELLSGADMFGLHDVITACSEFLQKELHPSNCVGIYRFAEMHDCINLYHEAKKFIEQHFTEVAAEDEFCELPSVALKSFLKSEGLNIDNEFQVFQATMNWILYDVVHRRKLVFDLLESIRLPLIPTKDLEKYISDCPDLSLKVALQKLLKDLKTEMKMRQVKQQLENGDVRLQPRICSRRNIYVVGGYNRDSGRRWSESRTLLSVEKYDIYRSQWTSLQPMNLSRSGHGVAVLSGMIYAVGGESDCLIFDSGEVYDPITNKWTMICPMNKPRCLFGTCAMNGYLYVLGGWIGADIGNTIELYDPRNNLWTFINEMQPARYAMGVVAFQGYIYVIGGFSELSAELDLVQSFNPVTKEWRTLHPLTTKRAYVGVAVLNNCIYAVGGTSASDTVLQSVESYVPDEDKWTEIPPMTTARVGASVTSVNGKLVVIGGRTAGNEFSPSMTLNSVEAYDPETNKWTDVTNITISRCDAGIAVL